MTLLLALPSPSSSFLLSFFLSFFLFLSLLLYVYAARKEKKGEMASLRSKENEKETGTEFEISQEERKLKYSRKTRWLVVGKRGFFFRFPSFFLQQTVVGRGKVAMIIVLKERKKPKIDAFLQRQLAKKTAYNCFNLPASCS